MTVRHADQFPEGSSPDSIDWRIWNREHEIVGGIGGSQSLQDTIDIGNVWSIAGDAQPRVEFGADGALHFGDGATPIDGTANPAIYLTGDYWVFSVGGNVPPDPDFPRIFLLEGYPGDQAHGIVSFAPGGTLLIAGDPATVGHPSTSSQIMLRSFLWDGAETDLDVNILLVADPLNSYLSIGDINPLIMALPSGDITFPAALIAPAIPTSDPVIAGELFSIDAAGLAAALGAGARYVLISAGP